MYPHSRLDIVQKAREMGLIPYPRAGIKPGDKYIVWQNGDPVLFNCRKVRESDAVFWGYIISVDGDYHPFEIFECVKVTL